MASPRPHIHSHTALRGIAALVVVGYHLRFGAPDLMAWETATRVFERGYLWVDFFFILSGFVLCYVYEPKGLDGLGATVRYWQARFARVYPLHLAALLSLVAFKVATTAYEGLTASPGSAYDASWQALPFHLFLVHAWGLAPEAGGAAWNVPSWSISTEAFAYLCFPLLLLMLKASRAAFLVAAALLSGGFYGWVAMTTGDLDITIGTAVVRCLAGFVLGMALSGLLGVACGLPTRVLSVLQVAAIAAVLLVIEGAENDVAIILPFVLLAVSTIPDRGILCRILNVRAFAHLGAWSYSIYLLHVPVIMIGGWVFFRVVGEAGSAGPAARLVWIAFVFAVTILLSKFSYEWLERPARAWLSQDLPRRFRRRDPPPV